MNTLKGTEESITRHIWVPALSRSHAAELVGEAGCAADCAINSPADTHYHMRVMGTAAQMKQFQESLKRAGVMYKTSAPRDHEPAFA